MNIKAARELVLGLMGFTLIIIGVKAKPLSLMLLIGAWITIGTLFWGRHRTRREARNQGKEVIFM